MFAYRVLQRSMHIRHRRGPSLIWDMNYFGKSNPFVRHVINGWQLSAIVTLQSGLPFNVTRGSDVNLDGNNNDRVNVVADYHLDPHRSRSDVSNAWFNTAAFGAPAAGTDGNLGRNVLDAPGSRNVDLGIFRNFKFHERVTLQARGEMTNAFHLGNLNAPNGTLSAAAIATIRTAATTRQVQLGLRLTF